MENKDPLCPVPENPNKVACTHRREEITYADLPLACPLRGDRVWDAHPRVYLPIEDTDNGEFTCPYCDTHYILKDFHRE